MILLPRAPKAQHKFNHQHTTKTVAVATLGRLACGACRTRVGKVFLLTLIPKMQLGSMSTAFKKDRSSSSEAKKATHGAANINSGAIPPPPKLKATHVRLDNDDEENDGDGHDDPQGKDRMGEGKKRRRSEIEVEGHGEGVGKKSRRTAS